jgi:hypothetical protein
VKDDQIKVRLLFADTGTFHYVDLLVPVSTVESYDRLIDGLLEDPDFLKGVHVDPGRLCGAWVLDGDD